MSVEPKAFSRLEFERLGLTGSLKKPADGKLVLGPKNSQRGQNLKRSGLPHSLHELRGHCRPQRLLRREPAN